MSIKSLVKQVLILQQNNRYKRLLKKKSVSYDTWIKEEEEKADAHNTFQEVSHRDLEDVVCFLHDNVRVAESAMDRIVQVFRQHPEVMLVYGDEDVRDEDNVRSNPWFKPDWSPDLFRDYFYLGGMVAVRRSFTDKEMGERCNREEICDLVVRAGGFQKGCKAIYHLPWIICHNHAKEQMQEWLSTPNVMPGEPLTLQAGNMISIIIPSKDNPELLRKCFAGIAKAAGDITYEILVVDNGSLEENKAKIQALATDFEKTAGEKLCGVQYIYEPMEFNFSRMCNLGAAQARGSIYLFLNDDVELCREDTLKQMAELAIQMHAGAVGIKLLYPNSERMQHVGITNLPMGPVHKLQFLDDREMYYFNSNRGIRNVLGVTAACLMIEAHKFTEVRGFNEDLQVAFNDVDLCFKLYEAGYHNICKNDSFAFHYESLSRGDDESTEKWLRLMQERSKLYEKHPDLEGKDPYFGFGLAREGLDSRIRATYEIAGNKVQSAIVKEWKLKEEDCRKDNCLMVRIEECRQDTISGYAVVLGDNNACYDYELILKNKKTSECYSVGLEGQYRPDLVENMPDQVNVGLCGFAVEMESNLLPIGEYGVGMVARNRLNKGCILNFSSRIFRTERGKL